MLLRVCSRWSHQPGCQQVVISSRAIAVLVLQQVRCRSAGVAAGALSQCWYCSICAVAVLVLQQVRWVADAVLVLRHSELGGDRCTRGSPLAAVLRCIKYSFQKWHTERHLRMLLAFRSIPDIRQCSHLAWYQRSTLEIVTQKWNYYKFYASAILEPHSLHSPVTRVCRNLLSSIYIWRKLISCEPSIEASAVAYVDRAQKFLASKIVAVIKFNNL